MRAAVVTLLLVGLAGPAAAQTILQDFEQGLKYDQCWAGSNVALAPNSGLQGQVMLRAGPLSTGQPAAYLTPFMNLEANRNLRFIARALSGGGATGFPTLAVDLIDPLGNSFRVLTHQFTDTQRFVTQPNPGRTGVFRVRWTFSGRDGQQAGLDELNLDGTLASAGPPGCGPIIPGNLPPVAQPDAATSLNGASIVVNVLANDSDPDGTINPASVDLQPEDNTTLSRQRTIRNDGGAVIGQAVVDASGNVSVTPAAGFIGALTIPYSVGDNLGARSNITTLTVTVSSAQGDLLLAISGPLVVQEGGVAEYSVWVFNFGPDAVGESTLTIDVAGPITGITPVACGRNRARCGPSSTTTSQVSVPITGLAPFGSAFGRFAGTTTGPGTVSVVGTLTVNPPSQDPNPANNVDTVSTTVQPAVTGADLDIVMTGPPEVVIGGEVEVAIRVANDGPQTAIGVELNAPVPPGLEFVSASNGCPTLAPCALGELAVGAVVEFTARYRVPIPPGTILPRPPVTIAADVAATTTDPNPGNNGAKTSIAIITELDIGVALVPSMQSVPVGQTFSLFVTAGNAGPTPARNASVKLTGPADFMLERSTASSGTFDPSSLTWTIPEVLPGDQATLELVIRPNAQGERTVRAVMTPPETDVNTDNLQATAQVVVQPSSDVQLRLNASTLTPTVGTQLAITMLGGTLGPSPATGVRYRQTLPAGLRFVSATPSAGSFDPSTGIWTMGDAPLGVIPTLTTLVSVDAAGVLIVRGEKLSANEFDPDTSNNTQALILGTTRSADLSIHLQASNAAPVVGGTVTIRATVLNGGPSPDEGVVVDFAAAAGGIVPLSATMSVGSITGPAQWTIGPMAPHATATLEAVLRIDSDGALPLSALVSSPVPDPNPGNNQAQVTFNAAPDLGKMRIDFEDLTGSESCWTWPGMAPGGLTAAGMPFGRSMLNPPLQQLVHLVSSQMSGGTNRLVSPFIQLFAAGEIRFTTKISNTTSAPVLRVFLEDVATRTPVQVFERVYQNPPSPNSGSYESIPVTVAGLFRVRWEFTGVGGNTRAAIDDIAIDGIQATSSIGTPGAPVSPNDCRPVVPGNLPPTARPDKAITAVDTPVTLPLLANDEDPDGALYPPGVNLSPLSTIEWMHALTVREDDGSVLGQAVWNPATSLLTFTPAPGANGSGIFRYTVSDDKGGISNVAAISIVVGSATADLATTITGPTEVQAGQRVEYRAQVRNLGPDAAIEVPVNVTLAGAPIVAVTCSETGGGTCADGALAGGSFTTTLPGIPTGGLVTFTIVTTAPAFGQSITATITAITEPPVTDSNPANNSSTITTSVTGPLPPIRADLLLTLQGPSDTVVGATETYTIVLDNLGPSPAENVQIAAPPPPLFSRTSVAGDCTTLPCSLGTLEPNGRRTVFVTYQVQPPSPGGVSHVQVEHTAGASSTTFDPNPVQNTDTIVTTVVASYDLAVDQVISRTVFPLGQSATLSTTLGNIGRAAVQNVVVAVTMPPGLSASAPQVTAGTFDPATGRWSIPMVRPNDTLELRLSVVGIGEGPQTIGATIVEGLETDLDSSNDSTTVDVTVLPSADVGLLQIVDNASPLLGDAIVLTLTASNAGPSVATGVLVTTAAPIGLTLTGSTPSTGMFDAATGIWNLGTLGVGATATLTQTAIVQQPGGQQTSAVISAADVFDPVLANNSTGVALNVGPAADVGVSMRVQPDTLVIGDTTVVTVSLANAGPSDTTDVFVLGDIPAGLRIVSTTASQGVIDSLGRWSVGSMAAGATATLQLNAEALDPGTITGTARVTHAITDPNPVNDKASATINAGARTDLHVTVIAGTHETVVSQNATVFVVLTNDGPSNATTVNVDVALAAPPGMLLVGALQADGTFNASARRWTIPAVAAGDSKILTLLVQLNNPGTQSVSARVLPGAEADTNPGNDSDVDRIVVIDSTLTVADVVLTLEAPGNIPAGGGGLLIAKAVNSGSTYAVDLTIDVEVPQGLAVESVTPSFGGACPVVSLPAGGGSISCLWLGQSVVGASRLRQVTVGVRAVPGTPSGTRLTANGRVTSQTPDPFPNNNMATATTVVDGATLPDVALTKVLVPSGAQEASALVGSQLRWRLAVQNLSGVAVSNVRVTETLGTLLRFEGGELSQGVVDGASSVWIVGDLAAGATATFDVVATVVGGGRAILPATLAVGPPGDGNAANDTAAITIDVPAGIAGSRFVAAGNVDALFEKEIITGAGTGETPQVRVFSGQGARLASFYAYDPRFQGGVRLASCDFNGDGRDEIVTGAGFPDGGPHVRIFNIFAGERIVEVNSFYAESPDYRGGIYVACGDVNGDGRPELVTATGTIGPAIIRVWDVDLYVFTQIAAWQAFTTPEARPAVCDLDGDGRAEVVATSGPGSPARLVAFNANTGQPYGGIPVLNGFMSGAFVACDDLSAAILGPEVVVSADAGGLPLLEVYNGSGSLLTLVLADDSSSLGGTRVAIGDIDAAVAGNELIVGSGWGRLPSVLVGTAAFGQLTPLRAIAVPNLP